MRIDESTKKIVTAVEVYKIMRKDTKSEISCDQGGTNSDTEIRIVHVCLITFF